MRSSVASDGGIVGGGSGEGFLGETPLGGLRECAVFFLELVSDGVVIARGSDDGDIVKIFGRRADHGGPADVDVFDQFLEFYFGLGGSFLEGVEIDDDHVDGSDAVLGDRGYMFRVFPAMQDAAVNFRMQRLDTAVEHFGESGEVGDVFDYDAGVAQQFGGAPGGDEFDAERGELAGELDEPGFIGDGKNGALDAGGRHYGP